MIYNEDALKFLNEYNGPKFSFALSDAPYEIDHIGGWDKSGITYNTELYLAMKKVLLPGAFIAFYGYTRTHHRMMMAMEDAGLIIHKSIFAWTYTKGNPLGAANVQRNMDNTFAAQYGGYCECENPVVQKTEKAYLYFEDKAFDVNICTCGKPIRVVLEEIQWGNSGGMKLLGGGGYGNSNKQIIAASMTPEAEMFKSYTYGTGWSKPMMEPIVLAQIPYEGKTVDSIVKYGAGVVNVHGARHTDRWPGNIIAIHDPECRFQEGEWICNCPIGEYAKDDRTFYDKVPTFGFSKTEYNLEYIDWMLYDEKPSKAERHGGVDRNPHPSIKPISVNTYLGKLFLPPDEYAPRCALNIFSGSGSEMIGLINAGWDQVVGVEQDAGYVKVANDRIAYFTKDNNNE